MEKAEVLVPAEIRELLAARELPQSVGEDAVRFALRTSLESLLIEQCEIQGSQLAGPSVRKLFAQALMRSSHVERSVSAVRSFVDLADSLGLRYSIFKGAALANTAYHRPALRTFNDVDVLLGDNDPDTLVSLFTQLGRSTKSSLALVELARDERPVHEVAGVIDGIAFDLHFNAFGLVTPMRAGTETFAAASSANVELPTGHQFPCPSVELHLLIVLVNLCRRGGGAFRFYADAARLLSSPSFDWSTFGDLARLEGLTRIAEQGLIAVRDDLGITVDMDTDRRRAWWGPRIAEQPTAERLLRRAPLLALRLKPHERQDLTSVLRWYLPTSKQRAARNY